MSTPFIFEKNIVLKLITFFEEKEKISFDKFFMANKNITEFYLYSAFLEFIGNDNIDFCHIIHTSIYKNPYESWSITFINNKIYLNNQYKIFGLHRNAIPLLDNNYKNKLFNLYKNFYDNDLILNFIQNDLLKIN
jgi:hypothetical protein